MYQNNDCIINCVGAVYARELANVISVSFDELHMIARKYDKEFAIWTDEDRQPNIALRRSNRREDDADTFLSRKLSGLLRHRAEDRGFKLLEGIR